ncbi:hypothetical protein C2E23DRAFT_716373, partial [Lenzites betulinus]
MWLKSYLTMGRKRPTWARVADDLMARVVNETENAREGVTRTNTFLQHWTPKATALPRDLRTMLAVARKYGLRQEGLAFERSILRDMPMWGHAQTNERDMRKLTRRAGATRCLIKHHGARTVGDFEALASRLGGPEHKPNARCTCRGCEHAIAEQACSNPHRCWTKAKQMMDLLPKKWDPRGEHPEDYEDKEMRDAVEETKHMDSAILFDKRITTRGALADTFRIFTEGEEACNEKLETRTKEGRRTIKAFTDGACEKNGFGDARAGAGVHLEGEEAGARSVRVPENLEQTNQVGEAVAMLLAT